MVVKIIPRMRGWSCQYVDSAGNDRDKFFTDYNDAYAFAKFLSDNVDVEPRTPVDYDGDRSGYYH